MLADQSTYTAQQQSLLDSANRLETICASIRDTVFARFRSIAEEETDATAGQYDIADYHL